MKNPVKIPPDIWQEEELTVADFMARILYDARYGYYQSERHFGRSGDFVTAPHISSLFGVVLGLWLVHAWEESGKPGEFDLIECGPGDGTLLIDVLGIVRRFAGNVVVRCVEINPAFRKYIQQKEINDIRFCDTLEEALQPGRPAFVYGNEFLDALPVHQFIWQAGRWCERVVLPKSRFSVDISPVLTLENRVAQFDFDFPFPDIKASEGDVLEICPRAFDCMNLLSSHIMEWGGGAIFVDYGHDQQDCGDTLQAVRGHRFISLEELATEGGDLTAHVDFYRLKKFLSRNPGLDVELQTQREFLLGNGIIDLAIGLKGGLSSERLLNMDQAIYRLTGRGEMGTLFKVLSVRKREDGSAESYSL